MDICGLFYYCRYLLFSIGCLLCYTSYTTFSSSSYTNRWRYYFLQC